MSKKLSSQVRKMLGEWRALGLPAVNWYTEHQTRYRCADALETLLPQIEAMEINHADTFDQFWDYIAAHYGVPAGRYTPAELVNALAESVRREERQKAERLAEVLEATAKRLGTWVTLCENEGDYDACVAAKAALADFRKGHANEQ